MVSFGSFNLKEAHFQPILIDKPVSDIGLGCAKNHLPMIRDAAPYHGLPTTIPTLTVKIDA